MVNVNDYAGESKYLKADDIRRFRLPLRLRIADVQPEVIGQDRNAKSKLVVYFERKDKGVALNRTNTERLVGMFGTTETDEWIGNDVGLTIEKDSFKGTKVDCLRFVAPPRAQPQREAAAEQRGDERRDEGRDRDRRDAPPASLAGPGAAARQARTREPEPPHDDERYAERGHEPGGREPVAREPGGDDDDIPF